MKRLLSLLTPRIRFWASMSISALVFMIAFYAAIVTQNWVWLLVAMVELNLFVHMGMDRDRRLRDSSRIVFLTECVETDEKLMEESIATMDEAAKAVLELKEQNEILLDQLAMCSTREIKLLEAAKVVAAKRVKKAARK